MSDKKEDEIELINKDGGGTTGVTTTEIKYDNNDDNADTKGNDNATDEIDNVKPMKHHILSQMVDP